MEKLLLCSRVLLWVFAVFGLCRVAGAVNRDGVALIAFKTAITEDPEGVLNTWNASDQNPCSWTGISCAQIGQLQRVVAINLPKRRLVGILPSVLGSLIYLRHINLKHNRFNGTLPAQLFSVASIQSLVFYGNILTGPLPEEVARLKNLQILDLSYNSFQGTIPSSITKCSKLRRLQLNSNNFSGPIPHGIGNRLSGLQQLDLSFNRFSGSIPPDLGNLTQLEGALKLSNNILTGPVPATLGNLPEKVSLDLTYNNLSGQIPQNGALVNQGPTAFVGNPGLCGLPLRKPCPANHGSVVSNFPDMAPPRSQPSSSGSVSGKKAISRKALIAIIVGDVGGILLLSLVFLYCYWKAMSCRDRDSTKEESSNGGGDKFCRCLSSRKRDDSEVFSENMEQSDLVALDGQVSYDLDELLRASAFVLGKSGVGIVYKVVLEDGLTLAVRRLGEGGSDRYKEFQAEVESLGRLRHPNVVALRAYYWSVDEKLLIYDYVPNGSLATALHGAEAASSPLLWAARLKIAKGVARGLAHIHECCPKRHIHGDLKPSNILLGLNMEPYIADLGLGRIASVAGTLAIRPHITMLGSMYPESKVSSEPAAALPSMSSATLITQGILMSPGSAYQAPEASKNPKPTQKWDVYSYGVMLLELLSGKSAIVQVGNAELDLVRWVQLCIEEKQPLQDVLDSVLIEELYREEEILGVLKIALSCVQGSPDRRPSMKHVAEMLDKVSAAI